MIDEHTFEVVAKEPTFPFLYVLLSASVVPKHIWESVPVAEWRDDAGATGTDPSRVIGSGPFKFQEWRQGESVTLVRNDDYYGKVPYIDTYTLRIWPDRPLSSTRCSAMRSMPPTSEHPTSPPSRGTPGITVVHYPTRGFTYYEFNLDPEVTTKWQDQRVRQALCMPWTGSRSSTTSCSATRKWRKGPSLSSPMPMRPMRSRPSTPTIRKARRCSPKQAGPTRTAMASSIKTGPRSP